MSTREERLLAAKQVFVKVLQSDVKGLFDDARRDLEPRIEADESVAAVLPDGRRIGSVKRSKASESAKVTDEQALLKWVRKHRPDELVESVNPAFVDLLKAACKKHGLAVLSTGEIVPGVEMVTGSPSYLPQPDEAMVPVIRGLLFELLAGVGLDAAGGGNVTALLAASDAEAAS